jgi:hypothetical protein
MRTLVQRLKRLWNTPVEFYGVDRPEPQAGPWHGLLLFVVLLVILGLLWLIRYLPERTYLVQLPSISAHESASTGRRSPDLIFRRWTSSLRQATFGSQAKYYEARALVYAKAEALKDLFEYSRSRLRICRGWTINSVLILCSLNAFIWLGLPKSNLQIRLSICGSLIFVLLTIGTLYAWYRLTTNENSRLLEQSNLIKKDPYWGPR